jgi:large subunit ribosomal protein L19
MTSILLHEQAKKYAKKIPDLRPGYTVRVHERIKEGEKERTQIFEGLVIGIHRGHSATDATFTVRRIASGIGVEKIFSALSPMIEKIEVKKIAKVRRAKLSFLRGRQGKSARLSERFTQAEEFAVAVAAPVEKPAEETETKGELQPEVTEEPKQAA